MVCFRVYDWLSNYLVLIHNFRINTRFSSIYISCWQSDSTFYVRNLTLYHNQFAVIGTNIFLYRIYSNRNFYISATHSLSSDIIYVYCKKEEECLLLKLIMNARQQRHDFIHLRHSLWMRKIVLLPFSFIASTKLFFITCVTTSEWVSVYYSSV